MPSWASGQSPSQTLTRGSLGEVRSCLSTRNPDVAKVEKLRTRSPRIRAQGISFTLRTA